MHFTKHSSILHINSKYFEYDTNIHNFVYFFNDLFLFVSGEVIPSKFGLYLWEHVCLSPQKFTHSPKYWKKIQTQEKRRSSSDK